MSQRSCEPQHLVAFVLGLVLAFPDLTLAASKRSAAEDRLRQCVLAEARASDFGNPMVAAYNAADQCPSPGVSEEEREQIIGTVVRQIMNDVGVGCIGTGCE